MSFISKILRIFEVNNDLSYLHFFYYFLLFFIISYFYLLYYFRDLKNIKFFQYFLYFNSLVFFNSFFCDLLLEHKLCVKSIFLTEWFCNLNLENMNFFKEFFKEIDIFYLFINLFFFFHVFMFLILFYLRRALALTYTTLFVYVFFFIIFTYKQKAGGDFILDLSEYLQIIKVFNLGEKISLINDLINVEKLDISTDDPEVKSLLNNDSDNFLDKKTLEKKYLKYLIEYLDLKKSVLKDSSMFNIDSFKKFIQECFANFYVVFFISFVFWSVLAKYGISWQLEIDAERAERARAAIELARRVYRERNRRDGG